jgi:hypothetical protein
MSWLFSQALVEEYLEESYLDGEQSVLLNGKPMQQAYCAPDKMTAFSKVSQSGMMFKPLTESLGEELLMSYREDSHARTYLRQEKAQELTENGQECGKKWQGLLAKLDQNLSLWKTAQCLFTEDSEQFLLTFPKWGSMRNGELLEQTKLAHITKEKGNGLWPTPTTPSGGQCRWFWGAQKRQKEWDLHTIFNQPEPVRMVDGVASRVDRLKAIGNGQVPQVAAIAWDLLMERIDGYEQRGMEKHLRS